MALLSPRPVWKWPDPAAKPPRCDCGHDADQHTYETMECLRCECERYS